MKQASSVTKVTEETTKNRKLNSSKNNNLQQRQSSRPFERMKSNQEAESDLNATKAIKPKSSLGRRPMSSQKYSQTLSSQTVVTNPNSTARGEEEVKQIITNIFKHSKKLQSYIEQKSLDEGRALQTLLNNDLFTLSLVTMISNKNPEEINKYVERSCIHKLGRMVEMEKQKNICEGLENRIEQLINKRIKALSHYQ